MKIDKPTIQLSESYTNATNANIVTIQAGVTSASYTLTLPVDDGNSGQVLKTDGSGVLSWLTPTTSASAISVTFDGGGGVITTGMRSGFLRIPFSGTITGWTISSTDRTTGAALSGSIVIDAWKDTYANFPPTVADTIFSGNKPTLTSASKNQNSSMSVAVSAGDMIGFNIDSCTTCVLVNLTIEIS